MANKTAHVTVGFTLGLIYIFIDFFVINKDTGFHWLYWVIALLLAVVGAEGPDFDHLYDFMSHRDIVSHSAFYPAIFFGLSMWWKYRYPEELIVICMVPYFIGYSSHLFLDYFPNIDVRDLHKGEIRIKEKRGTFLMHVPFVYKSKEGKIRRTLDVKHTETWLLVNSFLCLAMAGLLATGGLYLPAPA